MLIFKKYHWFSNSFPAALSNLSLRLLPGILLSIICVAFTSYSQAQQVSYYVQHFNSENGMPNSVKGMETDKQGYLWFATEQGLVRYDGTIFRLYNKANSPQLKSDRLINIGLTRDSNVYVEAEDKNRLYFNGSPVLQIIQPEHISRVIREEGSSVHSGYTVYANCKLKYNNKAIAAWALPDYKLITRSLLNSVVYLKGYYYYFNNERELIAADTNLTSFKKLVFSGELKPLTDPSKPVSLIKSNGQLYLRWDKMIYHLNIVGQNTNVFSKAVLEVDSIANITNFLQLKNYQMDFVGTMADGFYIFQKKEFSTLKLNDPESNIFYAQQPYRDSGVLSKKGVLFPNSFIPFPEGYTSESILKTVDGNYFLNKIDDDDDAGIIELNSNLKEIANIKDEGLHLTCIMQLQDRSIWLSALHHFLGKVENDSIKWMQKPSSLPTDFPVSSFIQTSNDVLLAGGNNGLAKIDIHQKTASLIPELNGINVRCLYKTTSGFILIGTYGNGYYALYKNKVIAMPQDQDHFLEAAHAFLEDNSGHLWISTNNGLFELSMQDLDDYINGETTSLYYYYFDHNSGFLTNEFNGGCVPSAVKLSNGKFSFPALKGLVQFYPDSIQPLFPQSPIQIDAIVADKKLINPVQNLSLTHSTNHLSVFVSSPYFGNRYNQTIEYNISRTDSNWYTLPGNGVIDLNKLPTGNYVLQLRKKAGFGKNNYIKNQIAFTIQPAFYETWLFRICAVVCVCLLLYFLYRLRIAYIIKQKNKLENEVAERTKEQQELINSLEIVVAELEQSKEELYQNNLFKEKLAMIVAHDLQSPLKFLNDAIQRANKKAINKEEHEVIAITETMQKASVSIYRFIDDFVVWLKTLGKSFHPQYTWVNVHSLAMELNVFFNEQLKAKNNRLHLDVDEDINIFTDYQLIKIILRNLIDNANKYTENGHIYIKLDIAKTIASLKITDSGKGIHSIKLKKIQSRIKNADDYTENEAGFGYRFIAAFCRQLGISIDVESDIGSGTIVTLKSLKFERAASEVYS